MSGLGLVLLFVIVTGSMAGFMRQMMPPVNAAYSENGSRAIVVLGGGRKRLHGVDEHTAFGLTHASLERAQQAAELVDRDPLPLFFSGGATGYNGAGPSEAALMAQWLSASVETAMHLEERSRNTWENAVFTARLLKQQQIEQVMLVTSEAHLARATLCFRKQGIRVQPVAAGRLPANKWVPSTEVLNRLPSVFYEWAALIWYRLRYF